MMFQVDVEFAKVVLFRKLVVVPAYCFNSVGRGFLNKRQLEFFVPFRIQVCCYDLGGIFQVT